jgi:hypothetical protein
MSICTRVEVDIVQMLPAFAFLSGKIIAMAERNEGL